MARARFRRPAEERTPVDSGVSRYINRELSWLAFNQRVLEEALDARHPLLERVKFLAIFSTNMDEFFMIRVAGIKRQIAAGVTVRSAEGLTPADLLAAIRRGVIDAMETHRRCWLEDVQPKLCAEGIHLLDYADLTDAQRAYCTAYFEREIFPVLTPLAIDPSHPFPNISNLSLNLAVVINDPEEGQVYARVKVPASLPRLIAIQGGICDGPEHVPPANRHCFVWVEQVIAGNLQALFPGEQIIEHSIFRITRNLDMEIAEEEAEDLLLTIEEGVRQRRFGAVVRLLVQHDMPGDIQALLLENLKLGAADIYEARGPLGLSDLISLLRIDRPDLKDPPFYPSVPSALRRSRTADEMFAAIRQQDILLHHPFDSFEPLVSLIEAAAEDPSVLAIKQALYRVGSNSPIVQALMHAREEDKQVTVLVELKARFDEENNITWARALESAGVHVVYGVVGLKTHAKLAQIVRREQDGLRCYVHVGTGNYNAGTSRVYTDLGLLTARDDINADVSEVFNLLTGYSRQRKFRKLLVAPVTLRDGIARLIERETEHARAGRQGAITLKLNALVDRPLIDLLYTASQAGVVIDLIVRGMCCLRPGVPGLSETITVSSIVGRFLEHSRIYHFGNDGSPETYIGSADVMERNLDRRVETLAPIEDPALAAQLRDLLEVYRNDTLRARILRPNGEYERVQPDEQHPPLDSQVVFLRGRETAYE